MWGWTRKWAETMAPQTREPTTEQKKLSRGGEDRADGSGSLGCVGADQRGDGASDKVSLLDDWKVTERTGWRPWQGILTLG